tara:strand:+ start:103735 stop:104610 length:876 start_codon:yes stop_codon:yes gene_type:complete
LFANETRPFLGLTHLIVYTQSTNLQEAVMGRCLNFLSFCLGASLALTSAASASDVNTDRNWQGFYAGLAFGGAHGAANPDSEAVSSGYFSTATDLAQLNPGLQQRVDGDSLTGSALIGYDVQDGSLIYGIEADFTLMDYSRSTHAGPTTYISDPVTSFTLDTNVKTDFSFSIRPKLGYAFGNMMFYAAAGPTLSQFKYTTSYLDDNLLGVPVVFSDTKLALGVSLNAGATIRLDDQWSLRSDYVFNYYPNIVDERHSFDVTVGGVGTFTGVINNKSDFRSHNLRFALIRYF